MRLHLLGIRPQSGSLSHRTDHTHSVVLLSAVLPVTDPSSLFDLFTMPATDALSKLPNSISRRYQLRSTKTGLLGLSPETRKTIYHYLFEDAEIDSANDKCDEDPILSVCKTIRNEAKVMFYKTAWIGIFEESGPTFTSNIYNYSENVQLSCYNPRMPDFGQLDHMRTLRHIHLHAQLCDNMGMQPHAEEEQLLEAIKIDLDYEISLMQDFARKYPKAKVDIESSFYPMRRHATMIVRCPQRA